MYSQTKNYLKNSILKLIKQTNDTFHKQGEVTIYDIQSIVDEIKSESN